MDTKLPILLIFFTFGFVSYCNVAHHGENFAASFHPDEVVPILEKQGQLQIAQLYSKPKEDFIFGRRHDRDFLTDVHVMKQSRKFMRHVSEMYKYPLNSKPNKITCVKALDQGNTGGHAVIQSGGPGYNYVTLQITSKISSGFNYKIEIYVE